MPPHECPTQLQERHEKDIDELYARSLPQWFRAIMFGAFASMAFAYCGSWAYATATYATRGEMDEMKQALREMRAEIRADLKEISGRLETTRQAKP